MGSKPTKERLDPKEMRKWLRDFDEDMFHITCQRCSAPFQASGYAVAAPPEWYGVVEWVRESADALGTLAELTEASRDYRDLVRAPYAPNDAEFEKWYALLGAADERLAAALEAVGV